MLINTTRKVTQWYNYGTAQLETGDVSYLGIWMYRYKWIEKASLAKSGVEKIVWSQRFFLIFRDSCSPLCGSLADLSP